MVEKRDIRERETIAPQDVVRLNFIRDTGGAYVFRAHLRRGLRSHLMEVLHGADVKRESSGVLVDGIRRYPRAEPVKMLRLFRRRFPGVEAAVEEIRRFKKIRRLLTSRHLAISNEFLVDYRVGERCDTLLCGLQEFVHGIELDPWHPAPMRYLGDQYDALTHPAHTTMPVRTDWFARLRDSIDDFTGRLKKLVRQEALIPDLAGVRNLLVTRRGQVKLVDINNISAAPRGSEIRLDDLGYPVADKSLEVIGRLETHCLGRTIEGEGFYRPLFDRKRRARVQVLARAFHDYICSMGMCDE